MTSINWKSNFAFCFVAAACSGTWGLAQQTSLKESSPTEQKFISLLQGKDLELPGDFVAKLDGKKLRVALDTIGITNRPAIKNNLMVKLFGADGSQQEGRTNLDGEVVFDNVQSDMVYAVAVNGNEGHGVMPVLPISDELAKERGIQTEGLRLPIIPVDREAILTSLRGYAAPASMASKSEVMSSRDMRFGIVNSNRVRMTPAGILNGRVVVLERGLAVAQSYANVAIYHDMHKVGQATSAQDGTFMIDGLSPGIHSVIASGPAGYSAFAFEVLPAANVRPVGEEVLSKPVSAVVQQVSDILYVCLVPSKIMPAVAKSISDAYVLPDDAAAAEAAALGNPLSPNGSFGPMAGGGGFGGGFSGGGSGGGGFGGGGLIAAAGLAGIAALIANQDDDDDNFQQPDVVSPLVRQ